MSAKGYFVAGVLSMGLGFLGSVSSFNELSQLNAPPIVRRYDGLDYNISLLENKIDKMKSNGLEEELSHFTYEKQLYDSISLRDEIKDELSKYRDAQQFIAQRDSLTKIFGYSFIAMFAGSMLLARGTYLKHEWTL